MFALGLLSWLYTRPTDGTERFLATKFGAQARPAAGQPHRAARRAALRGDHRGLRALLPGRPGAHAAGHLPQHHRQRRPLLRAGRRRPPSRTAAHPRLVPDHPGLRHPAHPGRAQALRGHDHPGRGRDRRRRHGTGCLLRRSARADHDVRPGPGPQGRDDRPGHLARAAAGHRRRPARRAVDRAADQDRAGRPAAGDVRPQRRVTDRRRRPPVPGRLLRHRDRSHPDRDDLPHPGDHPVRRIPRQRLGALAAARHRRAAGHRRRTSPPCRTAIDPTGAAVFHPYPARPEDARPAVGRPRYGRASSTESAASRRKTSPATSPTTRTTTTGWSGCARPRSSGSPTRSPTSWSTTQTGEARLLVLGWGSTYGPIAAAARLLRNQGHRVARAHLRHLNPFPRNLGDVLHRLRPRRRARDEPRPARDAAACPLPRRHPLSHRGARPAVLVGGAGQRPRGELARKEVSR